MVDTACTGPRLGPVLDLHAQQLKPVYVGLYPVAATAHILVELTDQIACELLQLVFFQLFSEVGVEVVLSLVLVLIEQPRQVVAFELDLDLNVRLRHIHTRHHARGKRAIEAHRGRVERLIYGH